MSGFKMPLSPQATRESASILTFLKPLRQFIAGGTTRSNLMSRTTELGLGLTHLSSVNVALSLPWVSFPPLGVRAWPGHSTPKAPLAPEPCLRL